MEPHLVTNRLKEMQLSEKDKHLNLYQHLSLVLQQLPQFEQDKIPPITNLEFISEYFKKHQFKPHTPLTQRELDNILKSKIQYQQWLQYQSQLTEPIKSNLSESLVQNFDQQAEKLFSKIGVGFGKEESFLIYSALKKLAESKKVTRVRFWGKILTRTKDYLIASGFTKQSNAGEAELDTQKVKEGVNYNCYWVTQDLLKGQWYELPLVTPKQMRAARLIKYTFSGNLNNIVTSSPPFDGLQKHLLKAQIVRITHNCQIVPKGLYAPLEDNPDEVDFGEEFKMPDFAQLSNLQNWVHFNPYILKLGRANYYVDPKIPQEQREQVLAKLGETDPKIERLKAINEDKGLQKYGLEGCWIARTYGSTQQFNNVGKEQGTTTCYGVVSLRNPHWPGWVTIASPKQFGSIYIGYGLKSSQASFHPLGPEDISVEADEVEECHEPNPKDPPDELEPDSDEENKKPEQ